uniref:beta-glucosidase n=1 Tax=Blastobotrys adeninivorans TaxID=409370 RepID=A0A060TB43_BLAAD
MVTEFNVERVLSQLSVDDKIKLLSGFDSFHMQGLKEHNVPSLRLSDGPNGVRGSRFFNAAPAACFPCGTGMGATFDTDLLYRAGKLMATEAKAKGAHAILGPTVNIQRSPLGGRGFESFAEDPLLSGDCAAAVIKGMQDSGIQATIKHFVGNDQEHERRAVNAIIPARALREVYLLPFQIAMRDSNPAAIMTAYNQVNGMHVADNHELLTEILRNEWKWRGMVMSDWFGTYSTIKGVKAGVDLEMPGPAIWRGKLLKSALESRDIKINDIDERARNVLNFINKAITRSGIPENAPEGSNDTKEAAEFLREMAGDSIVLLKNQDKVLPLKKEKTTAVIGPSANVALIHGGGSASLTPYYATTPLDGIKSKTAEEPKYAIGVDTSINLPVLGSSLETADGKPGFMWRSYDKPASARDRQLLDELRLVNSNIFFPEYRLDLDRFYVDLEGYFTPQEDGEYEFGLMVYGAAKLYVDDKLVVDNDTVQRRGDSFLGTGTVEEIGKVPLSKGQKYKVTVSYYNESHLEGTDASVVFGGGLRIGGRKVTTLEETMAHAIEVAKSVDQVVLCLGLGADYESEGFDRTHMDLPDNVDRLVSDITNANPNVVVVLQTGTPVSLPWLDKVKGLVHAWYGGNEAGNAIADVLFGDVNPSGKLPLTFPKRVEDNPAYFNYRSENGTTIYGENVYVGYRFYEMVKRDALFPFGFGLSYTTFDYGKAKVQVHGSSFDSQQVRVSVDVTNTGRVAGKEAVQIYIGHRNPLIRRPYKELKGFGKVMISPGQTKTVEVTIPLKYATSYWDESRDSWISEKATYDVFVASSSDNVLSDASFTTSETNWWNGV